MVTVLYILKNTKGSYYVGVTEDIQRRLSEHNVGKSLATRGRGPWDLVYTETFPSPQEAKRREYQIKQKKRKSYIEWLLKNRGSVV
ncbi:MAG: GIY-YIG nuclease family protein [Patescibacteria group bacterium]|nr:GIY-YIG nuclease family protein [Patescibacteria group bacterium]